MKVFKLIKFLIISILISSLFSQQKLEINSSYGYSKNENTLTLNHLQNGISLDKDFLLLKYSNQSKYIKFHLSVLNQNYTSINEIGFSFNKKNTYFNLGKLPINKSTENDFVLSKNAKPFFKIELGSIKPYTIKDIFFDYSILFGKLNNSNSHIFYKDYSNTREDKYLNSPLFHRKFISVGRKINELDKVTIGFAHGAMFGGEILKGDGRKVKPKSNFDTFIDIFFLQSDNSDSEYDNNVEGNNLGFWYLEYFRKEKFKLYVEKFYDDKSGILLKNSLDGLWGIEFHNLAFLSKLTLEYLTTTHQSGKVHPPGIDSYYWHHIYTGGWQAKDLSLGNPFIYQNDNRKEIIKMNFELSFNDDLFFDISLYDQKIYNYYGSKGKDGEGININHNEVIRGFNSIDLRVIRLFSTSSLGFNVAFDFDRQENYAFNFQFKKELIF